MGDQPAGMQVLPARGGALRRARRGPTTPGRMRTPLLLALILAAAGCRCSPATPQPVTLRIVNGTADAIYVDATDGRLGLGVQREVAGALYGFDDLACECRFCSNACNLGCTCPDAGPSRTLRIPPGGQAERGWDGVVQVSGASPCADTCLSQENAPLNEAFAVELCFSTQAPTGARFDDAGIAPVPLPLVTRSCTTRRFAPQDLVVEVGPARGGACVTTADCAGVGEACFDGACTTGCPANTFPSPDAISAVEVAFTDMGFFLATPRGAATVYSGEGTLRGAVYSGSKLELSLVRTGAQGEALTAQLQLTLPPGSQATLAPNTPVAVLLVDDGSKLRNRAVVVRDGRDDEVLLAADEALGGRILGPAELAPFTVDDSGPPLGCQLGACGRFLYVAQRLARGAAGVEVRPGATADLTVGAQRWQFTNVQSGSVESDTCPVTVQKPWVLWRAQGP